MKPVMQTRLGKGGNCWAACWATLLSITLEEAEMGLQVDTSDDGDTFYKKGVEFAKRYGYHYFEVPYSAKSAGGGFHLAVGMVCLGIGASPRKDMEGFCHVVILRYSEDGVLHVAHDPHPQGGKLKELFLLGFLMPILG